MKYRPDGAARVVQDQANRIAESRKKLEQYPNCDSALRIKLGELLDGAEKMLSEGLEALLAATPERFTAVQIEDGQAWLVDALGAKMGSFASPEEAAQIAGFSNQGVGDHSPTPARKGKSA